MMKSLVLVLSGVLAFAAGATPEEADPSVRVIETGVGTAYVFTSTGEPISFTFGKATTVLRALVVGGGGAGGCNCGGGGGAGGLIELDWRANPLKIAADATVTLTVGAGGQANTDSWQAGGDGGNSTLTVGGETYVALGGGGGGSYSHVNANPGGCGGGSSQGTGVGATTMDVSRTGFYGNPGGAGVNNGGYYYGGGGGGAAQAGVATSSRNSGKGGDGRSCDITGESGVVYAGGGGGGACTGGNRGGAPGAGGAGGGGAGASGADVNHVIGESGTDGFGGGGGGGAGGLGSPAGGNGGSGTVILLVADEIPLDDQDTTRTVSVADFNATTVTLAFGAAKYVDTWPLYAAYGTTAADATNGYAKVEKVADVPMSVNTLACPLPDGWGTTYTVARFFLYANADGEAVESKSEAFVYRAPGCATAVRRPRVSVMGDSYSSWNPADLGDRCVCTANSKGYGFNAYNGVTWIGQTYWMQFIDHVGGVLEKNNAWENSALSMNGLSGATVRTPFIDSTSPLHRIDNIGDPDILLICGGMNDAWCFNVQLGEYKYADWTDSDLTKFRPALAYLLDYEQRHFPDMEIIFVINSPNPNNSETGTIGLGPSWIESIVTVCEHYGVTYVQCHDIEKTGASFAHPTAAGFTAMAQQIAAVWDAKHANDPADETVVLPDGYRRIEYLQSTGQQYILTGVKPSPTLSFDGKVRYVGENALADGTTAPVFGCVNSSSDAQAIRFTSATALTYESAASRSVTVAAGADVAFSAYGNNLYPTLTVKGVGACTTASSAATACTSTAPMPLFACNESGTVRTHNADVRLYDFRICDGETVIRHFAPVTDPNGVAGLYDLVQNRFYADAGDSGEPFVAGEVIRRKLSFSATATVVSSTEARLDYVLGSLGEGATAATVSLACQAGASAGSFSEIAAGLVSGARGVRTLTGLSPATTYAFSLKAEDDGDMPGEVVVEGAFTTLPPFEETTIEDADPMVRAIETDAGTAYVFTDASRDITFAYAGEKRLVRALIVGGGGEGGTIIGGGGGGGAVVELTEPLTIPAECTVTVRVGAGGETAGKPETYLMNAANWHKQQGASGQPSSFSFGSSTYMAAGGGGGGSWNANDGRSGGNGGGGSGKVSGTTYGKGGSGDAGGHAGGDVAKGSGNDDLCAGGGGGAGAAGENGGTVPQTSGRGGEGLSVDITGEAVVYGAGGGGGGGNGVTAAAGGTNGGAGGDGNSANTAERPGCPGVDGTGAGGGGGGFYVKGTGYPCYTGGNGGKGTVILVFEDVPVPEPTLNVVLSSVDETTATIGVTLKRVGADATDAAVSARLVRDGVAEAWSTLAANATEGWTTSVTISDLEKPVSYVYEVKAENSRGETATASVAFTAAEPPPETDPVEDADPTVRKLETADGVAYVFTATGESVSFSFGQDRKLVRALLVGGGGAGGCNCGGGGGAGGYVELDWRENPLSLSAGTEIQLQVGAGGAANSNSKLPGGHGGDSTLSFGGDSWTALGGGGGGAYECLNGSAGGCGGGGSAQNSSKRGDGGSAEMDVTKVGYYGSAGGGGGAFASWPFCGGGGGATSKGIGGNGNVAGNGGDGKSCDITGAPVVYAGGGGGGGCVKANRSGSVGAGGAGGGGKGSGGMDGDLIAKSGTDGLGGGGGGGCGGAAGGGGNGGSGTVILVFEANQTKPVLSVSASVSSPTAAVVSFTLTSAGGGATGADVYFAYGLGDALGEYVKVATLNEGATGTRKLSGLTPASAYRYSVKAVNNAETPVTVTWEGDFTTSENLPDIPIEASDATVRKLTTSEGDVYVFTNTAAAATFRYNRTVRVLRALLVGGGGSGGNTIGGGGGGGGVVLLADGFTIPAGAEVSVSVGAGGAVSASSIPVGEFNILTTPGANYPKISGVSGEGTTLTFGTTTYTAVGGGGGASWKSNAGLPGGNGGGGSGQVSATDYGRGGEGVAGGHAGGNVTKGTGANDFCAGGGGGAGTAGENGGTVSQTSGRGGEGLSVDITGEAVVYGAGGGGGGGNGVTAAAGGTNGGAGGEGNSAVASERRGCPGKDGTGGGGGGGGFYYPNGATGLGYLGGNGGSGTVILVLAREQPKPKRGLVIFFGPKK